MDLTPAQDKAVGLFTSCLKRADKAGAELAKAVAENDEAQAELTWVAAHPALSGLNLNDIVATIRNGGDVDDIEGKPADRPAEEEKPKRTRRTKAQIAADKAAEEAAKHAATNPTANESDNAAQQVEGRGVSTPSVETKADEDDTFSEATPAENVSGSVTPAPTFPASTPAPTASTGSVFNPFAQA
jgi:hypothetical protein